MSAVRIFLLSLFVHLSILSSYVGIVHAIPCNRVPQGTGAGRLQPTGNFGIRLSSSSGSYIPGRQYIIYIERKNVMRNREGGQPKFIGFFLAIERTSTPASDYAEEFNQLIHGKLEVDESYQSLVRLYCGNVATHYVETPKSEIQVNWTAPQPGAGSLSIRATIIESRDVWYMDGIFLTIDMKEDSEAQADYLSNIQTTCCACNEAKYELSFEGLWSRNTHPKNFPSNEFGARFGDIIGATHAVGMHFWSSGAIATNGFKTVAETGETDELEQELKEKGDGIRTIIKARGLSHPNITTKTLAVFRVDPDHHLISFVSTMRPSPDWFVGISAGELCQADCKWLESATLDLYPYDAGTADGTSYENGRPLPGKDRREYIRRITSEWPASKDSPFYDENGTKMKPLAKLTLSRQRLYKKNCGDDDDQAEKEAIFNDPECDEDVLYSTWSQCLPKCKRNPYDQGTQTRIIRFKTPNLQIMCEQNKYYEKTRPCEIQTLCVGQDQAPDGQEDDTTQPDDSNQYETTTPIECDGTYIKQRESDFNCTGLCDIGIRNVTKISTLPDKCPPMFEEVKCNLPSCKNKDFCTQTLDPCRRGYGNQSKGPSNLIYYNSTTCTCMVFTTYCAVEEGKNIFDSFKNCTEACQIGPDSCGTRSISFRNRYSLV